MSRAANAAWAVPFLFLILTAGFCSCSDDATSTTPPTGADYFPFSRAYTWTYSSNVLNDSSGMPLRTIRMRIDTATSRNGLFWWMLVQTDTQSDWWHVMGLLDSAGVIYGLGDHPREGLLPLFRHVYTASEATSEQIQVQGTTYQTKRVTIQVNPTSSVTWWFADGIGLVKEFSTQGVSLFSDNHQGEAFECLTELTGYAK